MRAKSLKNKGKVIRGPRLIFPSTLCAKLAGWRSWLPWIRGLRLGNILIPSSMEQEHILIVGSQGRGKSSLIRSILYQAQNRGQPCVIFDPECEFVQEFYNESRGDVILNPLDRRFPFWSPWLEFRDSNKAIDIRELVSSIIHTKPKTQAELYWQVEGKRLLENLFNKISNLETLMTVALNDKTDGRETVVNSLQPFSLLPPESQCTGKWSALKWSEKPTGWIFLSSSEENRRSILDLQGIWLDLIVRRLLSGNITRVGQVFIIGDEVSTLGYQPQLEQCVTRGRKRGICTVLSIQNIAQMRALYGYDPTITLVAQPSTTILLKCSEPETAEWASKLLGEQEVEGYEKTFRRRIVISGQIQTLHRFRGYAIADIYRSKIKIERMYLQAKQEAFLGRTATLPSIPEQASQKKQILSDKEKDNIWRGIWQRCNNEKHVSYRYYGEKGVRLEFKTKAELFDYLGDPPADMIDPQVSRNGDTGNYCAGNIKWLPRQVNLAQKRLNAQTPPPGRAVSRLLQEEQKDVPLAAESPPP